MIMRGDYFPIGKMIENQRRPWFYRTPGKPESIEQYTERRKKADEAKMRAKHDETVKN